MLRAFELITKDLDVLSHHKSTLAWKSVIDELDHATKFWAEVRDLSSASMEGGLDEGLACFRRYFNTDMIDYADAHYLSFQLQKLAAEAFDSSDTDEGVRVMQDFFELEEGLPLDRTIVLAKGGKVSRRFALEEPEWDEEADFFRPVKIDNEWKHRFTCLVTNFELIRKEYSCKVSDQTIRNMQEALTPLLEKACEEVVSEGLYQALVLPVEFLKHCDRKPEQANVVRFYN